MIIFYPLPEYTIQERKCLLCAVFVCLASRPAGVLPVAVRHVLAQDVLGVAHGVSAGDAFAVDFHYSSTIGLNESVGSKLVLWPNPTTGSLSLNGDGLQQVEIFSMDGKQVVHLENGFESINVNALAKGCYVLKATFNDGSKAMQKFVKE